MKTWDVRIGVLFAFAFVALVIGSNWQYRTDFAARNTIRLVDPYYGVVRWPGEHRLVSYQYNQNYDGQGTVSLQRTDISKWPPYPAPIYLIRSGKIEVCKYSFTGGRKCAEVPNLPSEMLWVKTHGEELLQSLIVPYTTAL